MNRDSDNFVAEMLLKELGASVARTGVDRRRRGGRREALLEAGISLAGVRIADGSGLSRLDRLTAKTLVAILRAGAADPAIRDAFVTSLAVAGISGNPEEATGPPRHAREGDREDGNDEHLLCARRVRPAPLRLRDHPERLARPVLVGAPSARPLRHRPSAVR